MSLVSMEFLLFAASSGGVLLDPQKMPVDVAPAVQLYLLCQRGNLGHLFPFIYYHYLLCSRDFGGAGSRKDT